MENNNAVWIDREEYERLRALDTQPYIQAGSSGSASGTGATVITPVQEPPKKSNNTLIILTAISAIVSFIFPPMILAFLGLGIASIIKYLSNAKHSKASRIAVGTGLAVVGGILLFVAAPFILIFGFIIVWQLGCWTGLGECTTA